MLDTNELIIESFHYTFRKHLGREVPVAQLYLHFGEPLWVTMKHYAPKNWEQLLTTYREFNVAHHDDLTRPFPHAQITLKRLASAGIDLGVVTSKLSTTAWRGLKLFGLDQYLKTVITFEDTEKHKPEPDPILKALEVLGRHPGDALMVGDSLLDLRSAKLAGVKSAAVGWSVHPREVLEQEEPDYWLEDLRQVLDLCGVPREEESNVVPDGNVM